jgi:FkbM family methyltransferase
VTVPFRKLWYRIVSAGIWANEGFVFYPKLRRFYTARIPEAPLIFDVGANRGQTIRFFQSIFTSPVIHAFEPSDVVFPYLRELRGESVFVHQVALGAKHEMRVFYECVFDEVSSLEKPDIDSDYFRFKSKILLTNPRDMLQEKTVTVRTVDEIVTENRIPHIDILKIDVEGHELEVLKGASESLRRGSVRFLQIEAHLDGQYSVEPNDLERFLLAFNYRRCAEIRHGFGNFLDLIFEYRSL